jgi:SAM-dependent methyltransferase
MSLEDLRRNWDRFAETDPYWAIYSVPEMRGGKWDVAEFFRTGEREIGQILEHARTLGLPLRRRAALDFGCGAGRLTQALGDRFETATGVDVSPAMIRLAEGHNRHGARCRYVVNGAERLPMIADRSMDFVYASIVLQHMEPRLQRGYVAELVRVLAPGGLLVFQVPSEPAPRAVASAVPEGTPLPERAFRAALRVVDPPARAPAGAPVALRVRVRNESDVPWPGSAEAGRRQVAVGNHWRSDGGHATVHDDARAPLAAALGPGEEVEVTLGARAPGSPGRWRLEVDVVQEHVDWFVARGSPVVSLEIEVVRPPPAAAHEAPVVAAVAEPRWEHHCAHVTEVVACLRSIGAEIVQIHDDRSCGPEWISYRYWVTKDAPPGTPLLDL